MFAKVSLIFCALLLNAQPRTWQPNFEHDKDAFEVSASTYPWEVHDEGTERLLDNMQQMAGINSVYLIALMHHEPRPYNCERFPHNPVRRKWFAEDSRISWYPDLSLYGRIKPMLSDHKWLRDTDWLKVVTNAARKRKMKVGVEVSHTIFSSRQLMLEEYTDLIQRNLYGKPATKWGGGYVPCANHKDVEAYLIAIYTDLAKNYDVDYIQTCMLNFVFGDVTNGGCFCDACVKTAEKMGIDMEAIKKALRKDPKAQPYKDQWHTFRRKSVAALYKKITDAVRKANPKIDFRLNHWTRSAESGGMYIEDIAPMLGSIRLMSYEEQTGDPGALARKQKWIEKVRKRVGDDLPLLAAIGVRNKAYPQLIRQGVKVAVDGGVQGITLGHYDGAAHSILRAVRNGLAQAGVPGIRSIMGVEAEHMKSDNYYRNPWVYEMCVNTDSVGSVSHRFAETDGRYDIKISYADEKDGRGQMTLFINSRKLDSWRLDKDIDCWTTRTVENIALKKEDVVKIEGKADGNDWARIDFVEFIPKTPPGK